MKIVFCFFPHIHKYFCRYITYAVEIYVNRSQACGLDRRDIRQYTDTDVSLTYTCEKISISRKCKIKRLPRNIILTMHKEVRDFDEIAWYSGFFVLD